MASSSVRKLHRLREFEEKLQSLVSGIVAEADVLQSTTNEPVTLDKAWIFEHMKDLMVEDKFVLEPRADQIRRGLGTLLKLPREVRDMPAVATAKKIQKIDVRADARRWIGASADGIAILRDFENTSTIHNECNVTIIFDTIDTMIGSHWVADSLKGFTNFEQVIVGIEINWWGEPWPDTMADFWKARIRGNIDRAIMSHKDLLEPTLGPGELIEDGMRLVFHPRQQRQLEDEEGNAPVDEEGDSSENDEGDASES